MIYTNQSDKIYAQSLLELELDKEQTLAELNEVQEVFVSSAELVEILKNTAINITQRIDILNEVFKNKINDKILKFLEILTEKGRIDRFTEITECYKLKFNEIKNIKDVEIISAVELDENYKQRIITALSKKLNKEIKPQWSINPEIIGGLVYKINDTIIDTSIKNKLESFGKIMK